VEEINRGAAAQKRGGAGGYPLRGASVLLFNRREPATKDKPSKTSKKGGGLCGKCWASRPGRKKALNLGKRGISQETGGTVRYRDFFLWRLVFVVESDRCNFKGGN